MNPSEVLFFQMTMTFRGWLIDGFYFGNDPASGATLRVVCIQWGDHWGIAGPGLTGFPFRRVPLTGPTVLRKRYILLVSIVEWRQMTKVAYSNEQLERPLTHLRRNGTIVEHLCDPFQEWPIVGLLPIPRILITLHLGPWFQNG